MFFLSSGVFLGWSLGSNDAANVFGTAVASRMIRYSSAIVLAAVFVILGALLEGRHGLETISGITAQTKMSAFIVALTAALTVTLMTYLRLPVSTSQAVMGAIVGIGLSRGVSAVDWHGLGKIGICWIGTPIGAAVCSILLYPSIGKAMELLRLNVMARAFFMKAALVAAGCYGAYALGANNLANVTGVFCAAGMFEGLGALDGTMVAALVGGGSIALGILTYSRNVMMTVGHRLVSLDGFSALIATLSSAVIVHMYAIVGVPVSTSQAIVGAVLGIGVYKGIRTVNIRTLQRILFGWIGTPLIPGIICFILGKVIN